MIHEQRRTISPYRHESRVTEVYLPTVTGYDVQTLNGDDMILITVRRYELKTRGSIASRRNNPTNIAQWVLVRRMAKACSYLVL